MDQRRSVDHAVREVQQIEAQLDQLENELAGLGVNLSDSECGDGDNETAAGHGRDHMSTEYRDVAASGSGRARSGMKRRHTTSSGTVDKQQEATAMVHTFKAQTGKN
eukprot:INCI16170.4.p3 GENE.INCI16170.4~~INCI16170.4.p3  ORF type:complete len:107 (+),score=23.86 INCI16170.4:1335-1655(+)